jgi:transposase
MDSWQSLEGTQTDIGRHLVACFRAPQKIDAVFTLGRSINGLSPEAIAPLVNDLIEWMKRERAKLSQHNDVAKAMEYMLKHVDAMTRFLEERAYLTE